MTREELIVAGCRREEDDGSDQRDREDHSWREFFQPKSRQEKSLTKRHKYTDTTEHIADLTDRELIEPLHIETIGIAIHTRAETDEESDPEIECHMSAKERRKNREIAFFRMYDIRIRRMCFLEFYPDKERIDGRNNSRKRKRKSVSPGCEKSTEKRSNDHRKSKHHTKKSEIFRAFLLIMRDVRENSLSNRDVSRRDTIDDAPEKHPPKRRSKSRDKPSDS